jgi:LysR family transcriptional regulator for metE and metH
MDVDARTFELLEAIAADGTLTAASRRLHISQPALSQRLSGFEARLGVALFERQGRCLVPTRAGRRMITTSNTVLAELRAAERDLDDLRNGRSGIIRFASQCSTNYQWLPPVIHAYRERCHGVEVRIDSVPGDEPVPALLADQVDVALVVKADRLTDGVTLTPLFDDEMVAVVARDHPWAERPHVQAGDFDDVHLVLFDSYDPTRVPALPLPLPAGARPARVTTAPVVTELLVEMVATSHDVTVLASWVVEPYLRSHGVRAVRLTATPETRTWSCATRRGDQPPHVDTFVGLLTDHFSQRSTPNGPTPTRISSPLTAPAP